MAEIFTWNMQRGRSVKQPLLFGRAKAKAAKHILTELCNNHDFGFITEPGKDIRESINARGKVKGLPGYWLASSLRDNQDDSYACRPLIYSKHGLPEEKQVKFTSGNEKAERYPAAGIVDVDGMETLIVSLHATSGFGGAANASKAIDELEGLKGKKRGLAPKAVIVGGDMNSNLPFFVMPTVPTQQKGHTLDGFMFHSEHHDIDIRIQNVQVLQDANNNLVVKPGKSLKGGGFFHRATAGGSLVRVSDHAPVIATAHVSEFDPVTHATTTHTSSGRKVKRRKRF